MHGYGFYTIHVYIQCISSNSSGVLRSWLSIRLSGEVITYKTAIEIWVPFNNIDQLKTQYGFAITSIIKYGWNYVSIPKLERCSRWSLVKDKLFHPTLYHGCNYLSMLGLKVIHVIKRGSCCLPLRVVHRVKATAVQNCPRNTIGLMGDYPLNLPYFARHEARILYVINL